MPKNKANSVGVRVRERRKELKMSQLELAEKAGLKQPTISSLERGESNTSGSLASIAAALNVSALWLETGLGDKELSSETNGVFRRVYADGQTPEKEFEIPLLEAKGSCGNGRYIFSQADEFKTPIIKDDRWFLRHNVRPEDAFAIIADGFSMANYIVHGDIVFFTKNINHMKSGEIYIINTPDGLRIKRVHKRMDGGALLTSDNPDKTIYPDEIYGSEQAAAIEIRGRFISREG